MKSKQRYRVLCVIPTLVAGLQDALRESGYEVLLAFTVDHAVAACIGSEFHAVILDAELIRKEGSTLARTLKLATPNVPVLLLDHREDPARRSALPAGIDAVVFGRSPDAVLAGLTTLLGGSTAAVAASE